MKQPGANVWGGTCPDLAIGRVRCVVRSLAAVHTLLTQDGWYYRITIVLWYGIIVKLVLALSVTLFCKRVRRRSLKENAHPSRVYGAECLSLISSSLASVEVN